MLSKLEIEYITNLTHDCKIKFIVARFFLMIGEQILSYREIIVTSQI